MEQTKRVPWEWLMDEVRARLETIVGRELVGIVKMNGGRDDEGEE